LREFHCEPCIPPRVLIGVGAHGSSDGPRRPAVGVIHDRFRGRNGPSVIEDGFHTIAFCCIAAHAAGAELPNPFGRVRSSRKFSFGYQILLEVRPYRTRERFRVAGSLPIHKAIERIAQPGPNLPYIDGVVGR
jgi:hypothetical protein